MRRFCLVATALFACTSTEPPASPPAIASAPAPVEAAPATVAPPAPVEAAPDEPAPAVHETLEAPRPTATSSDPKCVEATALWAAGADAMANGQATRAKEQWMRLLRDFPTCPAVPHAFLGVAEHLFDSGDMQAAKQTYQKVAQFPDPELRAFALYKQAWCELNLGEHEHALSSFVAAARQAEHSRQLPHLARLHDVALRDSVLAFLEVGQPKKAAPFYATLAGPREAPALLRRLSEHYRDRGDAAAAAKVCEGEPGCADRSGQRP